MKNLPKSRKYWITCGVLFALAGIPFLFLLPVVAIIFEVLALILILASGRLSAFYRSDRPAAAVRPAPAPDPAPADALPYTWEHARVAGVTYHEDDILALSSPAWYFDDMGKDDLEEGEKFYELSFKEGPVSLVPEPSNPHDKNAIMVLIDGHHVGYIKSGSCAHYLKLIRDGRILDIKADIRGGRYKALWDEDSAIERDSDPFSIKLSVKVAK